VVQLHDQAVTGDVLPESVLHYVLRTRESVILDEGRRPPRGLPTDPYLRQHQARSILCLPLITRARLTGVLYLENSLTPRAFAPARSAVLKLLASQAAIALESAHLYRDLEQREARIRRLVDANIIGIYLWELEGRIVEANDTFLRMVGFDREDLVSGRMRWTNRRRRNGALAAHRCVEWLKMAGRMAPVEREFLRKDGQPVCRCCWARPCSTNDATRASPSCSISASANGRKPKAREGERRYARCRWRSRTPTVSPPWGSSPPRSPTK